MQLKRFLTVTALTLAFLMPGSGYAATGALEGVIEVSERGFFGGLRTKNDQSGVLVYLSGYKTPPPTTIARLTQRQKTFLPPILPVVAGQQVEFPNEDDIYHNVFSVSPKASFDLGQYRSGEKAKIVRFEQSGLVPVYCNIHPQMIAYIAVLENNAFALTDKDGKFTIKNIPPGKHKVNVWVSGAKRVAEDIEITAGQTQSVSMKIQQVLRIKPHKRKDNSAYPDDPADYPQ